MLTVYVARKILTMDPGRPFAEAVACRDGKVVSTGTLDSMKPWLERYEHRIDRRFEDKVILPGFIDPHTHLLRSAGYLTLHYIGPIGFDSGQGIYQAAPDRAAVVARLREADAAEADRDKPIVAWGFDPAIQGGHLDRRALDAAVPDRPVWVIAYAPHFVYLNSAALALVDAEESDVYGVERYPDGSLSGVFMETEATSVALGTMRARINREGGVSGLRRMANIGRNAGVTTTAEMTFGYADFDEEWQIHADAAAAADFPLRMVLVPVYGPLYRDHEDRIVDFMLGLKARNTDKLVFHGLKVMMDGSFPALSLRLNYPGYLDGGNGAFRDVPWGEMHERLLPFWKAGIQVHCHANGDEAVDATLDVLERLQLAQPRFDHRFTIEHYCISSPSQARRLQRLGGLASVNNYFVHYRGQLHADVGYGPDRSEAVARLGSLEREGVIFALHSDFNLVAVPMHPLTAVWVAINRIGGDGETVLAEGEKIDIWRALRAVTIDAAFVLRMEDRVGSIEPGKFADFAILDEDPTQVDPLHVKDIRVWGTVLGGIPHAAES